jgi:hypothetical protein
MQIVCAWCQREGRPAVLGERPPLDDPRPTHGICDEHRRQVLSALATTAAGRPPRLLVIVRVGEARLYEYLTRSLAGVPDVQVLLDRRRGDRRREPRPVMQERRRGERRHPPDLSPLGFQLVRSRGATTAQPVPGAPRDTPRP